MYLRQLIVAPLALLVARLRIETNLDPTFKLSFNLRCHQKTKKDLGDAHLIATHPKVTLFVLICNTQDNLAFDLVYLTLNNFNHLMSHVFD